MKFNPNINRVFADKMGNWKELPTYDGKELLDTCKREGAYDYRNIPSMRNGERVSISRHFSMTSSVKQIVNWRG